MSNSASDFLNLLAHTPGDLFYFLLVLILLQATLFMALGQRMRIRGDRAALRYTGAAVISVLAWAAVVVGLLIGALAAVPADVILPPLERAAQTIIALVFGWAFLTVDHNRASRLSKFMLLVLLWVVIIGFFVSGLQWSSPNVERGTFNSTIYAAVWAGALLAVAVFGTLLTLVGIRIVVDAPLKIVYFALLAFGALPSLILGMQGSLPGSDNGILRLAFLAAMLLVPAVLYRMIIARLERVALAAPPPVAIQPLTEIPAPTTEPRPAALALSAADSAPVMKALGMMLEKPDPQIIPKQIVTAACATLKADIGALLTVQDANYADITFSYNKLLAQPVESISVGLATQPTLMNAIERRMQRALLPDRNVEELHDLYTRLDVEQVGPTYFQPLLRGGELLAVLVIGMPYSGRELIPGEMETLKSIGILGANLLAVSNAAQDQRVKAEGRIIQAMVRGVSPDDVDDEGVVAAWEDMHRQLDAARDQIVQLSRQVTALRIELDDERSRVTGSISDTEEGLSITGRIVTLTEEQSRLREERDLLNVRLRDAEAKLASASATGDVGLFQAMIDVLNREKEDLAAQRDALTRQIDDLRAAGPAPVPEALSDMLRRMSDEKARLEQEREQLRSRVSEIETQLSAFGVEGGASGLATLMANLYEQQTQLQARIEAMKREGEGSGAEAEKLRAEITNLAADRESLLKQREQMRKEKDELMARFDAIKEQRARVLAEAAAYQQELTESHVEQAKLRVAIQRAVDERATLQAERDRLTADKMALEAEREALLARVEGDQSRLRELGHEGIGSLTAMIDELSRQRSQFERDLLQAQLHIAELEDSLDVARIQTASQPQPMDQTLADQFAGLVQEFRTPMTSIIGYVDLILGESAGILGDMQRKFMQRVASNVKRLWTMTEDLHWVTMLDTGRYKLHRSQVDLIGLIEDALTNTAVQLREKDLQVHLDLDDDLPPIQADAEALQEVIGQLVTNAYVASQVGGVLSISARSQRLRLPRGDSSVSAVPALVAAVRDSGPGIAAEDQPFVFSRRYKVDNPLIPGLGDTGVGMAVAKTLIELHGGEIWFETGEHGTTMFFALPYQQAGA